jgi:hypothetical protein
LANIAESKNRNVPVIQLMGVTEGEAAWNQSGDSIRYRSNYLNAYLGGYNTYGNVMKTLGLTKEGDSSIGVYIDRMTPRGKELAEAFRETIKDTEYYKTWRWSENDVPRSVILEYGNAAGLNRLEGSKDFPLLRDLFLREDSEAVADQLRTLSMQYYIDIVRESNGMALGNRTFRTFMYDVFSPRGDRRRPYPEQLDTVVKGWEIYQGRQLFTYSLETMWSYLLELLSRRTRSTNELLGHVFEELRSSQAALDKHLEEVTAQTPLTSEKREQIFDFMNTETTSLAKIWYPFLVMLDVRCRFHDRDDHKPLHKEFLASGDRTHLSLSTWIRDVEKFRERPVEDILAYIMRYYVLRQHQQVALNKLVTTRNETYHFTEDNGKLHFIAQDRPAFNTFRVNQGMTILGDLGYLKRHNDKWAVILGGANA